MDAKQQAGAPAPAAEVSKETRDRVAATKEVLQARLEERKHEMAERRERRAALNARLADASLTADERGRLQAAFDVRERDILREARRRVSMEDFEPLRVIGRGAFGEVKIVRELATGEIYACKSMLKAAMLLKNQVAHVQAERNAMVGSLTQWLVSLHSSFQDDER